MGKTVRIKAGTTLVLKTCGLQEGVMIGSRKSGRRSEDLRDLVLRGRADFIALLHPDGRPSGDDTHHLIGEISSRNGWSPTCTFDRAVARSSLFSELSR